MRTFHEGYIKGQVKFSAIHDWVESWHSMMGCKCCRDGLATWLGLTTSEYKLFVESGDEALEQYLIRTYNIKQ